MSVPSTHRLPLGLTLDGLHMADTLELRGTLLVLCLLVFALVFFLMLASLWWHRRAPQASKAHFHGSVIAELVWTTMPFVIVVMLVWPAVRVVMAR